MKEIKYNNVNAKLVGKQIENHADAIDDAQRAVIAILDCAKVLTALERSLSFHCRETGLLTGEGFATGNTLNDDSLPTLLFHAEGLVRSIGKHSESMHELSKQIVPVALAA